MNRQDPRNRLTLQWRCAAVLAICASSTLPACFFDIDNFAPRSAAITPIEGAIGTRRIPLTKSPAAGTQHDKSKFDAMTFAPEDLGYGPNHFYYLRHDVAQANAAVLGTISAEGTTTDRLVIGDDAEVQAFATEHDALASVVRDLLDNRSSSTGPR